MDMVKTSPIDRDALLAITEGNWELVAELAALFRAEAPRLVVEARAAAGAGDLPRMRRAAHSLVGNARTLAAPPLGEIARTVERRAFAGDVSGAARQLDALDAAVSELCRELHDLVRPATP
jgi:HPt (histidine-containing phosphotransfer) domain-containing protein